MFYWIYDIPNWTLALLCCGASVAIGCGSVLAARPAVRRWLGPQPAANDLVSYFVSAFGVFYGLMLGLIAVGTYETFSGIEANVAREAATLGALYHDVSNFPEPARGELRGLLRRYAGFVVGTAWPAQRRGRVDEGATAILRDFERVLVGHEPATKAEEAFFADTIRQLNTCLELRRLRLNAVTAGLPPTLYAVVVAGAVLNLWLCCLFSVDRPGLHLLLVGMVASFLGLALFLIAAMDNPFRGEFSVSPEPFQALLDGLMRPEG